MKRRKEKVQETWESFEARVGTKRTAGEAKRVGIKVPNDILVQRMSSTASGRLKKFEPLDTRDFVPFSDYDDLTIENVKDACEKFYHAPKGTCDILASDRGPSCSKLEQIKGKKVYFIRFLPPGNLHSSVDDQQPDDCPINPIKSAPPLNKTKTFQATTKSTVFPKSVSISELLNAGRLIKPRNVTVLELESFDVATMKWNSEGALKLEIEGTKFAQGAFRNAYRGKATGKEVMPNEWVLKQYQEKAISTIEQDLKMTLEDHTRKQVQMHSVTRNIAKHFSKDVPSSFGKTFEYNKVYFTMYNSLPATVENFVDGDFHKFVNNDGVSICPPDDDHVEVYEKAQCFVHYSYKFSETKFMVLDIQGTASYILYDPEIATTELFADGGSETYFCAGNLSSTGIEKFKSDHICNKFCDMLKLDAL